MKKKILFIFQTAQKGGAELSMLKVIEKISPDISKESRILFLADGPLLEEDLAVESLFLPLNLPFKRFFPFLSLNFDVKNLNKIIKVSEEFDIIWTNSQKAHLIGFFIKIIKGKYWIVHFRDLLYPFQIFILRNFLKYADKIISVSDIVKNSLNLESEVIYDGFDLNMFDNEDLLVLKKPAIGMIANFQKGKGIEYLINIAKAREKYNFYLVGGKLFENIDFEFPENVHYIGYKERVGSFLKALDVGLFLSDREGLGRTCVEMAIASISIVGFDTGICGKITDNLCNVGDVECILKKLDEILESKKAKLHFYNLEEFDINNVAKKILNVIH